MATDNPKESLDQDYSQLEVASSEHVHQSPELVNYSTFGPEATSIPQDAAHSSYAGPQRSSSHVSPELVQEKWRPQASDNVPTMPLYTDEPISLRPHSILLA